MRQLPCATLALILLCTQARAETCVASYYGSESGKWTSSHERFNPAGLTAASRKYSPGDILRVSFGRRSVIVRVNDFGPAAWTHRCLDLSRGAAQALGIIKRGTARVSIQKLR